tara:strand:+ start:624 stop:896 length:273 start_codon:yes stop_codon:yes gene_type:complete
MALKKRRTYAKKEEIIAIMPNWEYKTSLQGVNWSYKTIKIGKAGYALSVRRPRKNYGYIIAESKTPFVSILNVRKLIKSNIEILKSYGKK